MSIRKDRVPKRQGYHHGNLKEALITAARRLIAERGPAGFTLIEAARLAGVSAAAPYRHFKDREGLIAEVALRGFAAFAERLEQAWAEGKQAPLDAFTRMGEAYLDFARTEPGYYSAMFAGPSGGPPLERDRAFGGLLRAVATLSASSGKRAEGELRILALQVWALAHGIASLSGAGPIPGPVDAHDLLRNGVEALIKGMSPR
jgi:AcrR family transcriptional regulator